MSCQLYRHFGADGSLLYVGITAKAFARLAMHRHGSDWFSQVATITIKHFATRDEARTAERRAIIDESPLFNRKRPKVKKKKNGSMRYSEAVKHFGSEADIAVALGRTRQAVNLWKQADLIPEGVAYQLQVITAGKLRVDPSAYSKRATA